MPTLRPWTVMHLSLSPRRALLAALFPFLILLCSAPALAVAHALLLRADPAEGALLARPPAAVHLWFSEDLNTAASTIVVWDRYRHTVSVGPAVAVPGQPRQLEVRLRPLLPGSYLVLWTSVSAQDGHILHGYYLFSVRVRGPGPSLAGVSSDTGQRFPDTPTLISLLAHWIELLAAVAWVGAALFSWLVFRPTEGTVSAAGSRREARGARAMIILSLLALIASSSAVLAMQAYSLAGNSWGGMISPSIARALFTVQYGQLWILRLCLAVFALVAALVHRAGRSGQEDGRTGAPLLATIGLVYLYALAASGHAASAAVGAVAGSALVSLAVFVDWLHLLADAAWFGGQLYIVLVLIPALALRRDPFHFPLFLQTLNRFSPAAYASVGLYITSGLFAAKVHVPSWYAFFNSIYGRTLLIKVALIGIMMLVSAITVYLLRPRLHRTLAAGSPSAQSNARLLHMLHVNPVLGAGVLLATSVLFYYPVPAGFAPPGPAAYSARGGGLVATVSISPDRSGANQITVLLDTPERRPVQTATVTVLATMLDMVMGTGLTQLRETGPGQFTGTADLAMGGRWRLQLLVYRPSGLTRLGVDVEVGV